MRLGHQIAYWLERCRMESGSQFQGRREEISVNLGHHQLAKKQPDKCQQTLDKTEFISAILKVLGAREGPQLLT